MTAQDNMWDMIKCLTKPKKIPINHCPKCKDELAVIARVDKELFYCISCDQDWLIESIENQRGRNPMTEETVTNQEHLSNLRYFEYRIANAKKMMEAGDEEVERWQNEERPAHERNLARYEAKRMQYLLNHQSEIEDNNQ